MRMRGVLARAELGWLASALKALQIVADALRSSATIVIARPQRRSVLITGAQMHAALVMATGEADGHCRRSGAAGRSPDHANGAGRRALGPRLAILTALCILSVTEDHELDTQIKSWATRRFLYIEQSRLNMLALAPDCMYAVYEYRLRLASTTCTLRSVFFLQACHACRACFGVNRIASTTTARPTHDPS